MSTRTRSPRQNRVAPDGSIHAAKARGMFMGNRGGRLHDATQTLTRARWKSKAWICCLTEYRGRHRVVMGAGYTELFFLDEAVALAAGHRPCFECRRNDANRFAQYWADARRLKRLPRATEMDAVLHAERVPVDPHMKDVSALPDGAIFRTSDIIYLKVRESALAWSFAGYMQSCMPLPVGLVEVLTPRAIVAVLAAGYVPILHPSAGQPLPFSPWRPCAPDLSPTE